MLEIIDGNRFWRNEKYQLHRTNGPACEYVDGGRWWWLNGKLHRVDGPAIEYVNEGKSWFLNGKEYTEKRYKKKVKEYVRD